MDWLAFSHVHVHPDHCHIYILHDLCIPCLDSKLGGKYFISHMIHASSQLPHSLSYSPFPTFPLFSPLKLLKLILSMDLSIVLNMLTCIYIVYVQMKFIS